MAIGQAMGFDAHRLTSNPLCGESTSVDYRKHRIDDRARPALGHRGGGW
jgi:hypothetical protein